MRKFASGIAAAALVGTALLGAGQAHAAPAPAAPAVTATPAPSCVKATSAVIFFRIVTVWMTNNCTTPQRVTPTWNYTMNPAPDCYELQPGQEATFQRDQPIMGTNWKFKELITC
ncbi:hypothetical protein ACWGHM_27340 [Streptomyces sp. NPDC054904]|uniref:hypothetical protein n=1 Tax=unclassified Streptomyces TaxID=2593676 RepID=UPI002481B778|nr:MULTISPECIES: hypothetical protein [unclassified Streptomyces]MDA5279423.1 hypothetical protein [Streptomyces sp. Isolate_45]MDX2394852.1 hypothetical protein [Streptomyces sp. DK15]